MTPDEITLEQALASAYLDGDVTAAERARVEGEPELLTLVASMRHVSTAIGTVAAPTAAIRERGIAAALAEFDALGNRTNVISLAGRRRLSTAVLSAAAAVILLGVVAVAVFQSDSGSNKSETASLETDTKMASPEAAEDAVGAGVPTNDADEVLVAMEAPIEIENPEQLAALTIPEPSANTGGVGGDGDAQRVESLYIDALACMNDDQVFLADIYYRGTPAIAVRDTVTGVTEAIDSTCTVLARVYP